MASLVLATVATVASGGFMTVKLSGKSTTDRVSCARSVSSAAVGDQVLVGVEGARLWVVALLGVAPPPPPPPPPPDDDQPPPPEQQETITGTESCSPTWTGSWRDGSWRPDTSELFQGRLSSSSFGRSSGAAFYGKKPRGLGHLTSGRLRLVRMQAGVFAAQTPTLVLLGASSRPSSYPSVLDTASGPSLAVRDSASWALPGDWLDAFEDGSAGGIGCRLTSSDSPYMKFDGSAMTLTLNWERTS